jgi:putative inorganic carbon (HCO3(-)) transporter
LKRVFGWAVFVFLVGLYAYVTTLGATDGLLDPDMRMQALMILTALCGGWLLWRTLRGWTWHPTALDLPLLVWMVAIALSIAFNLEVWRRSMIGVWYATLYFIVWYWLSDLIANRIISRTQLIAVVPLGALLTIAKGLEESQPWFVERLPLLLNGSIPFELPRPSGLLGNPNILAAILVIVVPLTVALILRARNLLRIPLLVLLVASLTLLVLTFSRGGWIGVFAALAVQIALILHSYGLLRPARLRDWFASTSRRARFGLSTVAAVTTISMLLVSAVAVKSLSISGRGVSLRDWIYEAAIRVFAEHPIAGSGLFTFGRGLAEHTSQPPYDVHSHAHNLYLNVAAELGIVGLVALAITGVYILHTSRQNWSLADHRERLLLTGAYAAIAGFLAHHLVDLPATFPVVALTAIVPLVAALAPIIQSVQLPMRSCRRVLGTATFGAAALIVTGFWNGSLYQNYMDVLYSLNGNFRAEAERLQPIIDNDPDLAVTYSQQGYLYGLAAFRGDPVALDRAIASFARYVRLEPYYVTGWVNLAALQAQASNFPDAASSMRHAVDLAPDHWPFQYQLGDYQERAGDFASAQVQYLDLLTSVPDIMLMPDWNDSPLRQTLARNFAPSARARTALLLKNGQTEAARALWDAEGSDDSDTANQVIGLWLAIAERNATDALNRFETMTIISTSRPSVAWRHYARILLAEARNNADERTRALAAAEDVLTLGPYEREGTKLGNIYYFQFYRWAIARQFLPQVDYPLVEPLLLHLLAAEAR